MPLETKKNCGTRFIVEVWNGTHKSLAYIRKLLNDQVLKVLITERKIITVR